LGRWSPKQTAVFRLTSQDEIRAMTWLTPKYYVYVILSLRGLYIGKGCGGRVRESMKERHGLIRLKVGSYFTQAAAYRAETRLIRSCRRLIIPLQNGRAPRTSVWRQLFPRARRRKRLTSAQAIVGLAFWGLVIWWLFV
jgi:hypothetical protein